MLSVTIKTFTCSKHGNSSDENEDAFLAPLNSGDSHVRVAVADGATESSFSREWADLLVSNYDVFQYGDSFNTSLLPAIKKSWLAKINVDDLPWYAQQKMELGAFASFLGIDIELGNGNAEIIAVGDSNAFVFRNDELQLAFPVEKSSDFGNTPILISTEPSKNNIEGHFFMRDRFTVAAGDLVILGTDAISQWILRESEIGNNPEEQIREMFSKEDCEFVFRKWLDEARENLVIKNDDYTIVLIQLTDDITQG